MEVGEILTKIRKLESLEYDINAMKTTNFINNIGNIGKIKFFSTGGDVIFSADTNLNINRLITYLIEEIYLEEYFESIKELRKLNIPIDNKFQDYGENDLILNRSNGECFELKKIEPIEGRVLESCEVCGCKKELLSIRIGKSSAVKTFNLCKSHMRYFYKKILLQLLIEVDIDKKDLEK